MRKLQKRWTKNRGPDQSGAVVSTELVFILTILVIGLLVGWVAIRDAVVAEMHDIAEAVGQLDQSYTYPGTIDNGTGALTEGAAFNDAIDMDGTSPADTNAGDNTAIDVQWPADTESN